MNLVCPQTKTNLVQKIHLNGSFKSADGIRNFNVEKLLSEIINKDKNF